MRTCPGCRAALPVSDGPAHPYIGASPECWAAYTFLVSANTPPLGPTPLAPLLADAYAAQHPGVPSPQSVQSVAVHLLAWHGVLAAGQPAERALWVRRRALRRKFGPRHERFAWLEPPDAAGSTTVVDITAAPSPGARARTLDAYVRGVWHRWSEAHAAVLAAWYDRFVVAAER